MPQELLIKERGVGQTQRDNFRKAHAGRSEDGVRHRRRGLSSWRQRTQFHYMVLYGMTAAQAIQAATTAAADLLGRSADVGSLSPGHFADLIAVTSDPLQRIEVLEHPDVVVKGGVLIRSGNK